jgi:hypothetical protein
MNSHMSGNITNIAVGGGWFGPGWAVATVAKKLAKKAAMNNIHTQTAVTCKRSACSA